MWEYILSIFHNNIGKIIIALISPIFVQLIVHFRQKFTDMQYRFSSEMCAPLILIIVANTLVITYDISFVSFIFDGNYFNDRNWYTFTQTVLLYCVILLVFFCSIMDLLNLYLLSNKFYIIVDKNDVKFMIKNHRNFFKDTIRVAPKNYFDSINKHFRILGGKKENKKDVYNLEKKDILINRKKLINIYKVQRRCLFRAWFMLNDFWLLFLYLLPFPLYCLLLLKGKYIFSENTLGISIYLFITTIIMTVVRVLSSDKILTDNNRYKSRFIQEELWK